MIALRYYLILPVKFRIRRHLRYHFSITCIIVIQCLFSPVAANADDWFSLNDKAQGETSKPPAQLSQHPLGKNTEREYPPNKVFTLWVKDDTVF